MHKRILFLSKGANASSTRYRALQYFPLYLESGYKPVHSTISGGLLPFLVALYQASQADIVVLLRKTFPAPAFWLLRAVSKKLIFELDDAIFSNTDGSYSKTRMSRFINTVRQCDHVFAGNQYLAEITKAYQANTSMVPTALNTQKYNLPAKPNSKDFVLVWIGSRSTKKYIAGILPAIEKAAKAIPNLKLKIIADFQLASDVLPIKNIPWAETTEAAEVSSADVGLAPLPADNWTKGKCALKVLQYLSAGLPVISSPTSANGYVVDHLKSGFLAETDCDWMQSIIMAYEQREQLTMMGLYGQQRVSREFDFKVVFKKIKGLLEGL
jgi:glycosyltransferase involved in cell wall biosynthesis